MTLPWIAGSPLSPVAYRRARREAIFRLHKWDQQVGDVATLCPFPLIMSRAAWEEVAGLAEGLAEETRRLEEELLTRRDLVGKLGLPRAIVRVLMEAARPSVGASRLVRFDFHYTSEGWRISEANTDVPGGWNEATGYSELFVDSYPHCEATVPFANAYAESLSGGLAANGVVALVHATAYADDHQAMVLLAERLRDRGKRPVLVSPEQVTWDGERAWVGVKGERLPVELIVRFYPGEWLPNLPRDQDWSRYFRGSQTPLSNPAFSLLTQSKRMGIYWDELETPAPLWRSLLPESVELGEVDWEGDPNWVVKPALGRVGDGIGLREWITPEAWDVIRRSARRKPKGWIAQRRFEVLPVASMEGPCYPCLGVYTIDGKVAGAYGRLSSHPLINHLARDVAILISTKP